MISAIEVYLPDRGGHDEEVAWLSLYHAFDELADLSVCVGVDRDGRHIAAPFALLYSHSHDHDRIRSDQDRAAARIGELLGLPGPIPVHAACRPIPPSEAARQLAARRVSDHRACSVCGRSFDGLVTARYCSNACRQRAKRARTTRAPEGE